MNVSLREEVIGAGKGRGSPRSLVMGWLKMEAMGGDSDGLGSWSSGGSCKLSSETTLGEVATLDPRELLR